MEDVAEAMADLVLYKVWGARWYRSIPWWPAGFYGPKTTRRAHSLSITIVVIQVVSCLLISSLNIVTLRNFIGNSKVKINALLEQLLLIIIFLYRACNSIW